MHTNNSIDFESPGHLCKRVDPATAKTVETTFMALFGIEGLIIIIVNVMLIWGIWRTKQQRMRLKRVEGLMLALSACDLLVGFVLAPGRVFFFSMVYYGVLTKYWLVLSGLQAPSWSVATVLTVDR